MQMQEVFNKAQGIGNAFKRQEIDMDIEALQNVDDEVDMEDLTDEDEMEPDINIYESYFSRGTKTFNLG